MCAYVSLKQPGPGEGFATQLTHAGQCVCTDVHLQRAQADILLVAVLAAEVFLTRPLALELSVLGQAREGEICFTTVKTLKVLLNVAL